MAALNLQRSDDDRFDLLSPYEPKGDQPQAIEGLLKGLNKGYSYQTLLGVTGSGKTYTMAQVINRAQRPSLVIAPNKTLAAQLANEFKEFFPNNAVEYFVSYYDYYQPEAYVPQSDTYIEKESTINEEIDRLRHSTTSSLLSRRDVIVVASVSCIYGLGSPQEYLNRIIPLKKGMTYPLTDLQRKLVDIQYVRSDMVLARGRFRVKGDVVEICPAYEETALRLSFFGDELESLTRFDLLTGEIMSSPNETIIYPATHFLTEEDKKEQALAGIEAELKERLEQLRNQGKLLEAQRLESRTNYDLEMMREIGFCPGIENYSRHLSGRAAGEPPDTLLSFFPDDFLVVIDESHITVPQLNGMYAGDRSRKETLVEYGFRLPSAIDNRPLRFEEFSQKVKQVVYVSATPGPYEKKVSQQTVEQLIRPTGLIDPEVMVRPTRGQVDDLIGEIKKRVTGEERVLVTTLTKKMAEDLADFLFNAGIRVRYLHSDIETTKRIEHLTDLRLGKFDVLVGINLLREGLDLPEVSLVAILDADKEGFLRSETSLIQTIGRAARNVGGQVIMYADTITGSMKRAIGETNRRRAIQLAFNKEHGIEPKTIRKAVTDILQATRAEEEKVRYDAHQRAIHEIDKLAPEELWPLIRELEEEMHSAAAALNYEFAAELRDRITELKERLPRKGARAR